MSVHGSSYYQRHMAVVAAATRGRYEQMVKAMNDRNMEPVIIEDLVRFGEDRGRAEGLARGLVPMILVIERKWERPTTQAEKAALTAKFETLGPSRFLDVVMDFDGGQLAIWLADAEAK